MPLLPFDLSLTFGVSVAVFILGLTAWLHNKWSRGNVLFALISFSFALWIAVDWFQALQGSALPAQVAVWRVLFYLTVSFGPALAMHAGTVISRKAYPIRGWIAYAISLFLFGIIDTAFLLRAVAPGSTVGSDLLEWSAFFGVLYYAVSLLTTAVHLYPIIYSRLTDHLERRRSVYGLVILTIFLIAGLEQFLVTPIPTGLSLTLLGAAFFLLSSMGFIRVRLLGVDFPAIEAFAIALFSAAVVTLLRASDAVEAFATFSGLLVIGAFGFLAVKTVRSEADKRHKLEKFQQELLRINEAKSDLVSMVAHQLRGPLGGIRFASDMLIQGDCGKMPEQAEPALYQIKNAADRLLSMAETSLNAARLEAGAFHTTRSEIDVVTELKTLLAEVEPFARVKKLEFRSSFTGIPQRLLLDREALRNVVFNLLDNAIKFTDRGTVSVVAFIRDHALVITVSDTGAGLSPGELKQVFRQFNRGRFLHDNAHNGSGLGLYVVKKLMEQVGGTVKVMSEGVGKGSTFTAEFPLSERGD